MTTPLLDPRAMLDVLLISLLAAGGLVTAFSLGLVAVGQARGAGARAPGVVRATLFRALAAVAFLAALGGAAYGLSLLLAK